MNPSRDRDAFASALLEWYASHGRHDLPWKQDPSPYHVWVSEIMLQQTQVATVVPYYERFVDRFPDVARLAGASLDEVLHRWSGLGYYARGRNLHRAAVIIRDRHRGEFPTTLEALTALPGIGRSTAGAILALSTGAPHPILDGNVKRVLARYHAVPGWPGERAVEKRLWALSARHTPAGDAARYTQAIMDLGATVCTRARPACLMCPVADGCQARASGRPSAFPTPRPARARALRETVFVVARAPDGGVLLERRPPSGIWGGLWSFPEIDREDELPGFWATSVGVSAPPPPTRLEPIEHGFTHYRLTIRPLLLELDASPAGIMEPDRRLWYKPGQEPEIGLAAPVVVLLERLARSSSARDTRAHTPPASTGP